MPDFHHEIVCLQCLFLEEMIHNFLTWIFFQPWMYSYFQSGDVLSSASFKFAQSRNVDFQRVDFHSAPRTVETYLCNQTWVSCAVPQEDFTDSQPHPSMLKLSHFLQNCLMFVCAFRIEVIWSMMFRWQSRKVFCQNVQILNFVRPWKFIL